jgi:hypothetical protein
MGAWAAGQEAVVRWLLLPPGSSSDDTPGTMVGGGGAFRPAGPPRPVCLSRVGRRAVSMLGIGPYRRRFTYVAPVLVTRY